MYRQTTFETVYRNAHLKTKAVKRKYQIKTVFFQREVFYQFCTDLQSVFYTVLSKDEMKSIFDANNILKKGCKDKKTTKHLCYVMYLEYERSFYMKVGF